jgi:shikimate dehydrogenase
MRKSVALIGYPLGHTLSPAMQNAAFKKLGLSFEYAPFEVAPKDLAKALKGFRGPRFAGFNVTIPHKEAVIPLLDEITPVAKVIGAVNTVVNREGRLVGYNTDGAGFIDSLKEDAKVDPKGKKVIVLGAGGASRAVSVMLAEAKASEITLSDIQEDKAHDLAKYIEDYFDVICTSVKTNSQVLQDKIRTADILVNTTPIGMHPKTNHSPLGEKMKLPSSLLVYDLVYNPSETKLLATAKAAGCKTCSGLGMLVRQGALAFTLWTGEEAPVDTMRQAAEEKLGWPACR